jgi:hypothetical protein
MGIEPYGLVIGLDGFAELALVVKSIAFVVPGLGIFGI